MTQNSYLGRLVAVLDELEQEEPRLRRHFAEEILTWLQSGDGAPTRLGAMRRSAVREVLDGGASHAEAAEFFGDPSARIISRLLCIAPARKAP